MLENVGPQMQRMMMFNHPEQSEAEGKKPPFLTPLSRLHGLLGGGGAGGLLTAVCVPSSPAIHLCAWTPHQELPLDLRGTRDGAHLCRCGLKQETGTEAGGPFGQELRSPGSQSSMERWGLGSRWAHLSDPPPP